MSELWTEKQRLLKPVALLVYYYFLMSGSLVSAHDIVLFSLHPLLWWVAPNADFFHVVHPGR